MLINLIKTADKEDMKKWIIVLTLFLSGYFVFSQEVKPLYQLPENPSVNSSSEIESGTDVFLVGSDDGLFRVTNRNSAFPLWTEGRVDQILQINVPSDTTDSTDSTESENADSDKKINQTAWIMRTSKGLFFSRDLINFEERNAGLPFLTVKKYENNTTTLEKQIQELKDLCVNPLNHKEMVTATKDSVFISKDAGLTWKNLGSMSKTTPGVKAVAVATIQGQTVVFMSHPIFGLSYIFPDKQKAAWNDVDAGFEKMPSLTSPDEISDIIPVIRTRADGSCFTEIYISQMYMPRIYKFNWQEKKG